MLVPVLYNSNDISLWGYGDNYHIVIKVSFIFLSLYYYMYLSIWEQDQGPGYSNLTGKYVQMHASTLAMKYCMSDNIF